MPKRLQRRSSTGWPIHTYTFIGRFQETSASGRQRIIRHRFLITNPKWARREAIRYAEAWNADPAHRSRRTFLHWEPSIFHRTIVPLGRAPNPPR